MCQQLYYWSMEKFILGYVRFVMLSRPSLDDNHPDIIYIELKCLNSPENLWNSTDVKQTREKNFFLFLTSYLNSINKNLTCINRSFEAYFAIETAIYINYRIQRNQYSICGKTRGGSAMYFWLNQWGSWKLGGWEAPEGVKPPTPPTNRALKETYEKMFSIIVEMKHDPVPHERHYRFRGVFVKFLWFICSLPV